MIIHSEDIAQKSEINADICIIGAGIAGITVARELAGSDLNVVILESGGFEPKNSSDILNEGENSGLPYYKLDKSRSRAFGGSSHLWFLNDDSSMDDIVRLRGMDAIDFERREWVPYSGWPFSKAQMDPYYARAHKIFKIGPYRYDAGYWEAPGKTEQLHSENGNIQTTIFQFARKNLFFSDYRRELENASNIQVILNATALQINLNEYAKRTESIEASSLKGKKFKVKAKHFILAQGGLEIPRLMLLSNSIMKSGVGNQHDLVGRYFMEHPHLWSGIYYPSNPDIFNNKQIFEIHRRNGLPLMGKLILSERIIREEKLLNNTVSIHYLPMAALFKPKKSYVKLLKAVREMKIDCKLINKILGVFSNPEVLGYAAMRKILRGDREKWFGKKLKYHGFRLNMMSEQIPNPESRVKLCTERDRFGQQKIELKWSLTSQDINNIRRFQLVLDRELRKNSLGRLEIELEDDSVPSNIHGGYHHMGTTRMDSDPVKGVVDQNCRVHGIDNLYIAGSSVFPTVGYANPTLTICALALKLADFIKLRADKHETSSVRLKVKEPQLVTGMGVKFCE